MTKTIFLKLELPLEVKQQLTALALATDADSLSQVVGRAIGIYTFLQKEKEAGNRFVLMNDKKERELVLK